MTPLVRAGVGVIVGMALASAGLWLGGGADGPDGRASIATSTLAGPALDPREPEWVPGGARYESTVIVPVGYDVGDGSAELVYEVVGLGAAAAGGGFGGAALPAVLPELWRLTAADGATYEAVTGPPAVETGDTGGSVGGTVRFVDLPDDATIDDVVGVAVVGWRVAAPLRIDVEMPAETGRTVELPGGVTVVLAGVIEQRTGSILDFDVDSPPNRWHVGEQSPFGRSTRFEGSGPGWISASSTIGGTGLSGGSTGFQLRWSELEIPDPVRFSYTTTWWSPVASDVVVVDGPLR